MIYDRPISVIFTSPGFQTKIPLGNPVHIWELEAVSHEWSKYEIPHFHSS